MALRLFVACVLGGVARASEVPEPPRIVIAVESGVRSERFAWRSGDGGDGNPPFSASWSGLRLATAGVRISEEPGQPVAVRLALAKGWILHGDNRQSGFSAASGEEVYRSQNDGSGGSTVDASADAGVPWAAEDGSWRCTALLGFQEHLQRLRQGDGDLTIPDTGAYDGLDSTFDAEWFGPRVGVEMGYRWGGGARMRILGGVSLLWYRAQADWNLRSDLEHPDSYLQEGRGFGWRSEAQLDLPARTPWVWSLRLAWDGMRITQGADRIQVAGGADMTADLDHVTDDAWSFALSVGARL